MFFSDLRLNKRLGKHLWGWWFETPWHSLGRHCNAKRRGLLETLDLVVLYFLMKLIGVGVRQIITLHRNDANSVGHKAGEEWRLGAYIQWWSLWIYIYIYIYIYTHRSSYIYIKRHLFRWIYCIWQIFTLPHSPHFLITFGIVLTTTCHNCINIHNIYKQIFSDNEGNETNAYLSSYVEWDQLITLCTPLCALSIVNSLSRNAFSLSLCLRNAIPWSRNNHMNLKTRLIHNFQGVVPFIIVGKRHQHTATWECWGHTGY